MRPDNRNPDILVAPILMLKLYRKSKVATEYWEAWNSSTEITIHWGKLGEEGERRELPLELGVDPDELIKREAQPIRAAGFKPLKRNELHLVYYSIQGRRQWEHRRSGQARRSRNTHE
jgi:hypothetical protein